MESLDNTGTHGVLHAGQLTGKIRVTIEGRGGGGVGVWGISYLVYIVS